ncbi:ABC-2 type transport system permease protein [Microbacterium terrae]|uniref:Transport permease protein n=1 Tax=Microbacterium terrae TaxID=69369 RepID=A0A0M2H5G3_9MICO|nr:ABC transporter permease [Microbacterium terrae]KJL41730.1 Teichoic acid translocation permease protein TagG [Microbacterium terrae]MBP1077979.1 ABC-2 type transport system permease protein [Microbacterium terrae]GLK00150.1 transport permease protein [Microbacterium terrae]
MDNSARYERLAAEPFAIIDSDGLHAGRPGGKLREIFSRGELLNLLVRRDLQARYRDSVLGFLWTVIRPLIQFLMYFIVLGQFLRAAEGIPQFAIYLFSGLTLFAFFSDMVFGATGSILNNAGLVKKIYLPREIFPLASIGAAGFMFTVQLVILLAAAIAVQALPDAVQMLWFFPSVVLILVYGLAIGLLLSALNVYLRDIQYLTEVVMMLAMWGSPIVYSWQMVQDAISRFSLPSWVLEIYAANPITIGVLGFHKAFWGEGTPADYPENLGLRMAIATVVGLVFLVFSHRSFIRMQGNFAQEL